MLLSWFETGLLHIELKLFVDALVIAPSCIISSLWYVLLGGLKSWTIGIHLVIGIHTSHGWLFDCQQILITWLFCLFILSFWTGFGRFCLLLYFNFLWLLNRLFLLFAILFFFFWCWLNSLFVWRLVILPLSLFLGVFLLVGEFIGDVECVNYFLSLNLFWQLLIYSTHGFLRLVNFSCYILNETCRLLILLLTCHLVLLLWLWSGSLRLLNRSHSFKR